MCQHTLRLRGIIQLSRIKKCIAKHIINPRISAVWSKTKPIATFSCAPRVQEVHTKSEVVRTPFPWLEIILNVSSKLKLYNNEDVATGTWLVPYKLNKTHTCGINAIQMENDCYSRMIVYHWQTREAMAEKYRNQVERGNPCPTSVEKNDTSGYYYNFDALPGQCCAGGLGRITPTY